MAKKKPPIKSSIISATQENIKKIEKSINEAKNIADTKNNIIMIDIIDIKDLKLSNGYIMQNRTTYSKGAILELAKNISELEPNGILGTGLLQAIFVRKTVNGYERIGGFRRIEAFKKLGKKQIPSIILENISDDIARFMRTSENLEREKINPYDDVIAILDHIAIVTENTIDESKKFLFKVKNYLSDKTVLNEDEKNKLEIIEQILARVGRYKILAFIDRLRVLNLSENLIDAMQQNKIGYSHAVELNKIKDANLQQKLLNDLIISPISKKELVEKIKKLTIKEGKEPTLLDELTKNYKKVINKSSYNKLDKTQKIQADKIIKEIIIKQQELELLL
jgi:ParB family chromosome partitioning protein